MESYTDKIKRILKEKNLELLEDLDVIKSRTKLNYICKICKRESSNVANNISRGNGCKVCTHPKTLSSEEFLNRVKEKYNKEYTILGKYTNINDPIKIRHNTCGHIWDTTRPNDFLKDNANTCPQCSHQSFAYTIEQYRQKVKEDSNGEYEVLSDSYKNNRTKLKFKHRKCGHIWDTTPNTFNNSSRCPECSKFVSKVVSNVTEFLNELEINFESEKTFPWLKYQLNLYLDFFLPEYNIAIECDGDQHYSSKKRGGLEEFKNTIKRDKTKFELCRDNGIEIIRLPSNFSKFSIDYLTKLLYERDIVDYNL